MRITKLKLTNFKRFDDLTIDLGPNPAKLIALVGPNGCGKSSVFDAFEQILQNYVGVNAGIENWYYSKSWFDATNPQQRYNKNESINITASDNRATFDKRNFYCRSSYRYTTTLRVNAIQDKGDALDDAARPASAIHLDQRLLSNYERLLGRLLTEFWSGEKTGAAVRSELVEKFNSRLKKVLDISITELGDVTQGKGQLFFEKGSSKNFPYEALSSGEKEVIDMLIDLEVKTPIFNDTVYSIDEPELHLNTAIQRKLLSELISLIPDSCQLWVATHSIGFLRAIQSDLAGQSQILDFSERDYFTGVQTIVPISQNRVNWKRIFNTALEDLTGLLAPKQMIYCEGRPDPTAVGAEQGLDAIVYNQIFEPKYPDALFISSGGGQASTKHSEIALKILGKAFDSAKLVLLKDRDLLTAAQRAAFLAASPSNRMLQRHEIENYLFDFDVLQRFAATKNIALDRAKYDVLVSNIVTDDLKLGQTIQKLGLLCGFKGSNSTLKKELSRFIAASPLVYGELHDSIFPI